MVSRKYNIKNVPSLVYRKYYKLTKGYYMFYIIVQIELKNKIYSFMLPFTLKIGRIILLNMNTHRVLYRSINFTVIYQ